MSKQSARAAAPPSPAAIALDAWRAEHPHELGAPCANCGIPLEGPFCLACGQSAESFERSLSSLLVEAVEGLFHADSRLWQTLQTLVRRPGQLTKDYLAGRRMSQTPPLRLFFVVILLFFFVGGLGKHAGPDQVWLKQDTPGNSLVLSPASGAVARSLADWLNPRIAFASSHQAEFGAVVESQLHATAILFLPIAALMLGVLFAGKRRIFIFDHAIFSMHSLSFMGLLFSIVTLMRLAPPLRGLADLLAFAAPVHLFAHMRSVYATSVLGTLIRMLLLFLFSMAAVGLLLFGDVVVGLGAMG